MPAVSHANDFRWNAKIHVPWSQRFFMIFLRERDQEQAVKWRQRVAKATRRKRKTSGYLGLESHFHADNDGPSKLRKLPDSTSNETLDAAAKSP